MKVVTKEGEATVHITLELNINVNTGQLSIAAPGAVAKEEKEEETAWVIPDFKPTSKIEFGRTVED